MGGGKIRIKVQIKGGILHEASTTEITKVRDAQGFIENKKAAVEDGTIAGNAREELERKTHRRVVSKDNYKSLTETSTRRLKSGKN